MIRCALFLTLVFAASLALAAAEGAPHRIAGEVSKIEGSTLTITRKSAGGAVFSVPVKVTDATTIQLETDKFEEITDEKGRRVKRIVLRPGKLADIKLGDRVTAQYKPDETAVELLKHFVR